MLSYQLWRALKRPPTRNPLFRRTYLTAEQPAIWYVGCVQWIGILVFLPIIALAGLVYGFGWSAGVATQIGRERERHTFDLISLTPPGPLGMSWAAALGYLHYQRTFRNVNHVGNLLVRAGVVTLLFAGFDAALFMTMTTPPPLAILGLHAIAVFVALLVDHVQSVVAAVLSGIVAGHAGGGRVNGQLVAFALYSGVQLATYGVTLSLFSIVRPLVFTPTPASVVLAVVILVAFAGSRELLLWLLWRWIDRLLAPDLYEQRVLLGLPALKAHS